MAIRVSGRADGDTAAVLDAIDQPDMKAIFYFLSDSLKDRQIHRQIASRFPGVTAIGASMIGGWASTGAVEKGLVAMSLSQDEVEDAFLVFREGMKGDPAGLAQEMISEVRAHLGTERLNPERYIGILVVDGLSLGEVLVKELTTAKGFTFPIIGGAAADELSFSETLVCGNGRLSTDGAALLLLKMRVPFFYNHYVHYHPTDRNFLITKAEPAKRIVWEIEGKPAAEYYAGMLGLSSVEEIEHIHFSRNPLGVVIGETVYTRSPNSVIDGKGLQFYCFIEAGTRMVLLRQGDIIENAREARREAEEYLGEVSGAILFNCVLRYLEMKDERKIEAFNSVFADLPFVGFNTYGEELFTHHNQTLTALFIGGTHADSDR